MNIGYLFISIITFIVGLTFIDFQVKEKEANTDTIIGGQ